MEDETGVGKCRGERSKSTEDAGEGGYGGVGYVVVDEVLVFCGGVNMARADAGDVGSGRAVGKERM